MINNFGTIEHFMEFEEGHFYKFECLIRNTDGDNLLYDKEYSNTNKNILIKSWWVDSKEYLTKIKNEMITLCNMTGGRLYVSLDRKSSLKVVKETKLALDELLWNHCSNSTSYPSSRKLAKLINSKSSVVETSDKDRKTIMFDIDSLSDPAISQSVVTYVLNKRQYPHVLKTKKGYHVFCYRKFEVSKSIDECYKVYNELVKGKGLSLEEYGDIVSIKPNALGLVYHPMKNETTIYEKILSIIEPYMSDFTGYNEEEQAFDIIQAVKELITEEYEGENNVKKIK